MSADVHPNVVDRGIRDRRRRRAAALLLTSTSVLLELGTCYGMITRSAISGAFDGVTDVLIDEVSSRLESP